MIDPQVLQRSFAKKYGKQPRIFSAPGRVNLIGEHTDYNDGYVLPMGANLRTYVAAALRDDGKFRVQSCDLGEQVTFSLDEKTQGLPVWAKYVYGVAWILKKSGHELPGADVAILSDVPRGAGLSSSAALEVSFGFALLTLEGKKIDGLKLALACQLAEHDFVGTKCGLMDQLTAVSARKSYALLIDCRSLDISLIPLGIEHTVVVVDSRVKHQLATSAYNERRAECERGVDLLRRKRPEIKSLRDLTTQDLPLIEDLPEPIRRRCRHVVTENDRTLRAAEALVAGDYLRLGQLLSLSHSSLRDDYEVSCRELDLLVEFAERDRTVRGARMMGGGFGGCTVNVIDSDGLENFCKHLSASYQAATAIIPRFYVVEAEEGAKEHQQ